LDKRPRILIVDDDESIRKTLSAILKDEGYIVDLAANAGEAIQKTNETSYNMAFIDIRLPDMEGVELLKLMKDAVPRTRKVILTGYPTMENAITALNKNADAYLIKPVDLEKLLNTVKEQLQLQQNDKKFSEQKVVEFIETRVKELSTTHTKN
jgi:DNA-binding NtrC family response regulator